MSTTPACRNSASTRPPGSSSTGCSSGKGAGEHAGVATITWRPNGSFVLSGARGARYALSVYHDSQQDLVKGYYRNFDSGANSGITDTHASQTNVNCRP